MFIGIDLTSSERKPSALVGLDEGLGLTFFNLLRSDAEIIKTIEEASPRVVAIDAPLTLSKGLCCLEESCPCQPQMEAKGRSCERELARMGIPCYFTTKRSIIKNMVYRAIGFRDRLEFEGYCVIEVYPYATKVVLFGKPIPRKTTPQGLGFLRGHLCELLPSLSPYIGWFNHDLCDAAICAYTAYLYGRICGRLIGDIEEGRVFIP